MVVRLISRIHERGDSPNGLGKQLFGGVVQYDQQPYQAQGGKPRDVFTGPDPRTMLLLHHLRYLMNPV